MSTTPPVDYQSRALAKLELEPDQTPIELVIEILQDKYEEALADSDKADSVDDVCYYDGIVDACVSILEFLTEEKE